MRCIVYLLFFVSLTACKTTGETTQADLTDDRPLWQTRQASTPASEPNLGEVIAFDGFNWRADESSEQLWLVIYPLLNWLANQARSDDIAQGYLGLMAELEPGASGAATQFELAFLMRARPEHSRAQEGLGLRIWRQVDSRHPTLTLVMWKDERTEALEQLFVWTHPDIKDAASSALITDTDAAFLKGTQPLRDLELAISSPEAIAHEASLLTLMYGMVWDMNAGASYLESSWRAAATQASEPPVYHPGLEQRLGLEVRDRELEEVLGDTSFPPRVEVDAIF